MHRKLTLLGKINGEYPISWGNGIIVPIYKGNDANQAKKTWMDK